MCFSAEADFAAGAVIGAIGVAALAKVEHPRELPLAVLPLAFAAHQVVEGFVWLGREGGAPHETGSVAAAIYLAFAWVIVPILVPLAVLLVEPDRVRKRAMAPFVALGAAAGGYLLWSMLTNGITAEAAPHTIKYGGAGDLGVLVTVLYVIATCTPPLLSSHRGIVWFGILDIAALAVIGWVQADGLTSLWCLWAAGVSTLIYLQLAAWRRTPDATGPELVPSAPPP